MIDHPIPNKNLQRCEDSLNHLDEKGPQIAAEFLAALGVTLHGKTGDSERPTFDSMPPEVLVGFSSACETAGKSAPEVFATLSGIVDA